MILVLKSRLRNYWQRLPINLRVIIKTRLWAALGAGGVLYLNPLIFNNLGFSAQEIGSGITVAAIAGISSRLAIGFLLDKRYSCTSVIKTATLFAILADFILFNSQSYQAYLIGQFILGAAAGLYWPSAELAIPLSCNKEINSTEAYSLARSADAIGITIGVLIGTIGTYLDFMRIVYFIDISCMIYLNYILRNNSYSLKERQSNKEITDKNKPSVKSELREKVSWIIKILPLLFLTLFMTGLMTLYQNLLPIDLVIGGIIRPPILEHKAAEIVFFKLLLVAIFQWPIGYWISKKNNSFKFRFCLLCLFLGCVLLSLSSLTINGYQLVLIALIPITISLCAFLPSASALIVKSSPIKNRGSAIALYSQCFGISALTIPLIAGKLIDSYGTAFQLWFIISLICILFLPITKRIK